MLESCDHWHPLRFANVCCDAGEVMVYYPLRDSIAGGHSTSLVGDDQVSRTYL